MKLWKAVDEYRKAEGLLSLGALRPRIATMLTMQSSRPRWRVARSRRASVRRRRRLRLRTSRHGRPSPLYRLGLGTARAFRYTSRVTLRATHGTAAERGLPGPRVEVLPADELPAPVPQAT